MGATINFMVPKNEEVKHYEEVEKELRLQLINFRLVLLAIFGLIAFSTWVYHRLEGWNWIDSVYFVFVTMGTVGYGDYVPTTVVTKLYTIFIITVGIGTFGYFASLLLKRNQLRTTQRQLKRLNNNTPKDKKQ